MICGGKIAADLRWETPSARRKCGSETFWTPGGRDERGAGPQAAGLLLRVVIILILKILL
jgi:hypothetical protein